jgi:hypothetical protein
LDKAQLQARLQRGIVCHSRSVTPPVLPPNPIEQSELRRLGEINGSDQVWAIKGGGVIPASGLDA